jgi:hypothetical protein
MIFPMRRGACPRLAEPMPTGDGLLARLAPIGTTTLDAFAGLCAAARLHGNGILEVTSRGSIQVRGLTGRSAPKFADDVAALDIDIADGVSITTDPLAGLGPDDVLDADTLADELRARLADNVLAGSLSPKISVVIDGGSTLGFAHSFVTTRHSGMSHWVGPGQTPVRLARSARSTPSRWWKSCLLACPGMARSCGSISSFDATASPGSATQSPIASSICPAGLVVKQSRRSEPMHCATAASRSASACRSAMRMRMSSKDSSTRRGRRMPAASVLRRIACC